LTVVNKSIILFLLLLVNLSAYESEDELKVILTGKVAKFITWQDNNSENRDKFVITVLRNPYTSLFDQKYKNKKIKDKDVVIKYIDDISKLSFTNILYIPKVNSVELETILRVSSKKNILTISSMRGFAQKGGAVQLFFISQKGSLKINLDVLTKENFKVKSSFVRISEVVKGAVY